MSELFIREFRRQSEFTVSFSLSHITYSLFHTDFCCFYVRYNNISVSISSSESDSELKAMIQPLLTSQDYKKLLLNVCSHSVTQCFPCCVSLPCVRLRLNMRSHCVARFFPCCVSLPCSALPCDRLRLNVLPAIERAHATSLLGGVNMLYVSR